MNASWFPCQHCGWMRPDCTCPANPVAERRLAGQARIRHEAAARRARGGHPRRTAA